MSIQIGQPSDPEHGSCGKVRSVGVVFKQIAMIFDTEKVFGSSMPIKTKDRPETGRSFNVIKRNS